MAENKWKIEEALALARSRICQKLELVGELVERDAKLLCPVDLGNLRNSIGHSVDETELSVTIGTNVDYAPYVEFGTGEKAENGQGRQGGWFYEYTGNNGKKGIRFTKGSKPQPFLRPALNKNVAKIKRILAG